MYHGKEEILQAVEKLGEDTIQAFGAAMDGHDYEQGEIEGQGASINRIQDVVAKLLFVLILEGVLTKKQAVNIVAEYGSVTSEKE